MRENNTLKTSQQISTRNGERRQLLLDLPKQPPKMQKKMNCRSNQVRNQADLDRERGGDGLGGGAGGDALIYWAQSEGHVSSFPLYDWENVYTISNNKNIVKT